MNKFSSKKLLIIQKELIMYLFLPLEMTVLNKSGLIKKAIAINEVSILRQSRQAASITIKTGKTIIKKLVV